MPKDFQPRIRQGIAGGLNFVEMMDKHEDDMERLCDNQRAVLNFGNCSGGCHDSKIVDGHCSPFLGDAMRRHPVGSADIVKICKQSRLPCPAKNLAPIIERYQNLNRS